jgi:hypothetical protein
MLRSVLRAVEKAERQHPAAHLSRRRHLPTNGVEQPIDDDTGRPEHIWMRTGRKPLPAGANADADMPILETARCSILIHHGDAG